MTEGMLQDSPPPQSGEVEGLDRADGIELADGIEHAAGIEHAEALTELKLQEVAYRGALGASDRVLQPTLKDFLR